MSDELPFVKDQNHPAGGAGIDFVVSASGSSERDFGTEAELSQNFRRRVLAGLVGGGLQLGVISVVFLQDECQRRIVFLQVLVSLVLVRYVCVRYRS